MAREPEDPPEITNRSLDVLDVLAGHWRAEISNAAFLDEGATLTGTLEASWLHGRAFLVLRSTADGGPPVSVQIVGRNESRDDFQVLYADDRGVSRVYAMTFTDGKWTLSREDPGFHQRFDALLVDDGARITGAWWRSHDDGETWVHDFDIAYTRL